MTQDALNQKQILTDIRNYLAGRVVGITRDETLLEEVLKCTICKAKLDQEKWSTSDPEELVVEYHKAFHKINTSFPDVFRNEEILLGVEEILFLHSKLSLIDLKEMPRDFFGDAYEAFIGNNFRGQEGQFFTPLNAVDLLISITKPSCEDTILDPACGAGGFLSSSLSYINKNSKETNRNIYGIDKDKFLSEITKIRLAIEYNSSYNIICADSLCIDSTSDNSNLFKNEKFSLILTNPPFGSKIIALSEENKPNFELAYKWKLDKKSEKYIKTDNLIKNVPPQILFLEKCISLLEEGGRLGIVIPESVISSPKYRYVAQYILENTTPIAIVGMPEDLFKTSGKGGTHTKVALLVLKKEVSDENHQIFMAEAKWCGHDSRGRTIPHDDIPQIIKNYENLNNLSNSNLGTQIPKNTITDFILAPKYYIKNHDDLFNELSKTYDLVKVRELINKKFITITTGDEIGKLAYGTGNIPFVRTSDLSNWEIKTDPKHLVSEEIYMKFKEKQDVRAGDLLMVRDGTYLIGTCAMITQLDQKMLYQSHIYKIRVSEKAPFDNYLLLALLSSSAVQSQIKSQSFTQDIINSLGNRIEDIIIPIPKSKNERQIISDKMKKIEEYRIETRKLMNDIKNLLP